MKREPVLRVFKAGDTKAHHFPTGTLLVSMCLLVGGMWFANVLPTLSFPRFTSRPTLQTSDMGLRLPNTSDPRLLGPRSDFPERGLGAERITLRDVSFRRIEVPLWPLSSRLGVAVDKGQISLTDPRTGDTIWTGPPTEARFEYSIIAATQILKDFRGRVLWSETPTPDLFFEKQSDGQASLSDGHGKILWSGKLSPTPQMASSHSDHRGTTYTIDFAGVRVNGINGYFTVIDGTGDNTRVLCSGTLPVQPVFLFREDHRFLYWGSDRSESGSDRVTSVRLTEETGKVTITDARSRVLGEQPVGLLKVDSIVHLVGEKKEVPVPHQYCIPYGNLAKSGSVLFTYQDHLGRVIRTNSVVREGSKQRTNNNGLPY